MFIDPRIEVNVDENQRAVIAQYDFEVRDSNGHYEISDLLIRSAMPRTTKLGRYSGGNLDLVLSEAVSRRADYVARNGAAKAPRPRSTVVAAPAAVDSPPAAAVPAGTLSGGKARGAPTEIEDADLDDTGKRERAPRKVREPKVRRDNRYVRAARIIAGTQDITAEGLSKTAGMKITTAGVMIAAWTAVTSYLVYRGRAAVPGVTALIEGKSKHFRARVVLANQPDITAKSLAAKIGVEEAVAAQCLLGWDAVTRVLEEKKWLLDASAEPVPVKAAKKTKKVTAAS